MRIDAESIEAPSSDVAQAFATMGSRLMDLRGVMTDLSEGLVDLDRLLAEQAGNARLLDVIGDTALRMLGSLKTASAVAASDQVLDAAKGAEAALDEIRSATRELGAVATLTLVTARSLKHLHFDDYVASLRSRTDVMRDNVVALGASVAELRARRLKAASLISSADVSLSGVILVLAEAATERTRNEDLLTKMRKDVADLAEKLQATQEVETGNLVMAMQFSDKLAQRLDHVLTIITAGSDEAAALARAQVLDLVDETLQTAALITSSLGRIGQMARQSAILLAVDGRQGADPAALLLELGRKVLLDLAKESETASAAVRQAEGEAAALPELFEVAAVRFGLVSEARDNIHLSAVNAALLAWRGNGGDKAMSVLSTEVMNQAAICAEAKTACYEAIQKMSHADDLAAFAAIGPRAAEFRQAVENTGVAVVSADQAKAELDRLRQATWGSLSRLADATQVAETAVSKVLEAASALSGIVRDLPEGVAEGADPLTRFLDIYTMESERVVHRRLFGLPEPAAKAPIAPMADDDDPLAAIMF